MQKWYLMKQYSIALQIGGGEDGSERVAQFEWAWEEMIYNSERHDTLKQSQLKGQVTSEGRDAEKFDCRKCGTFRQLR